jgi:hypothetical protein
LRPEEGKIKSRNVANLFINFLPISIFCQNQDFSILTEFIEINGAEFIDGQPQSNALKSLHNPTPKEKNTETTSTIEN